MYQKGFYLYGMEHEIKAGRPRLDPDTHKKNRALSLTNSEYNKLKALAKAEGLGVSAYVIKKLKLA